MLLFYSPLFREQSNCAQKQPAYAAGKRGTVKFFLPNLPVIQTTEKDHGRIELREYRLAADIGWLPETGQWDGLCVIGMVSTKRICKEHELTETRYFLTSLADINQFAYAVRKHWAIENQLHWCLDVILDEDRSQARKDLSPLNLNVLRKTALALCKSMDFGKRLNLQKTPILHLHESGPLPSISSLAVLKCCCSVKTV